MEKTFSQRKKQRLNKLDLSKKGSVDEDIEHVVSLLNSFEEYFTTSSCSGRIILIDGVREDLLGISCEDKSSVFRWSRQADNMKFDSVSFHQRLGFTAAGII